jgi:hypothetical protein
VQRRKLKEDSTAEEESEESREEGEEESFYQKEVGRISLQRKNH